MSGRGELDAVVVGAGSFGTALGVILAKLGRRVLLWTRREDQAREINDAHTNERYLGDAALPERLVATTDLEYAVRSAPIVLMVVPSQFFRAVARAVGEVIEGDQMVVHATKGFEVATFLRMSEIIREETCALKVGALSGPNLARELLAGHPAGALVASRFDEVVVSAQALFEGGPLRLYAGRDVVGTEVAGAFKNIIALAAGIADGLRFGDNTKALLVTRGLSEMARIGTAMGGDVLTFGGLAGIGDLMATCASPLSRNHRVGERLGGGEALDDILASMTSVAEGVLTTRAVHRWAAARGLELPIVHAVHSVLFEGWAARDAVELLMSRPVDREIAALSVTA